MNSIKKILFLTGTRADFGKIKSLLYILDKHRSFEVFVFVTGMHLMEKYGYTLLEIERCKFSNIKVFKNHTKEATMDLTLAKTVQGLSDYIKECKPNMIVVHGDRVETLAGAIVGSLNNVLVTHIEGGEISGTIDELIRHATSKLSHLHFVSNLNAKKRLIQMGELENSIFSIGSPDVDIMFSEDLPNLEEVHNYYEIPFQKYAIAMLHPVTTEIKHMKRYVKNFITALLNDHHNYVIIFPNNDLGSNLILDGYNKLKNNKRFKIFPSLRFEYFLTLLKNAQFIIGNSSAGVREAPYYDVPTINIGTRQKNRVKNVDIINSDYSENNISKSLKIIDTHKLIKKNTDFGEGNSAKLFLKLLLNEKIWNTNHQKQFRDLGTNNT